MLILVATLCEHCGHVDDLVPHPGTGASRRCPCPHDPEETARRQREVDARHRRARFAARRTDQIAARRAGARPERTP